MRILVSGSHGLIGSALLSLLGTNGHRIVRLVREKNNENEPFVLWDPENLKVQIDELENFDAVIHLAGESVATGRWNEQKKKAIYDSRVHHTEFLCEVLKKCKNPPKVFISASAIGYYGDTGNEIVDEGRGVGRGFLSQVCQKWEASTQNLKDRGIRVVNLRFGVVLSSDGGALAKMLTPFRLGLGGRMGSGRQYMSWIAIDDVVQAIHYILRKENLEGPINIVAPNPVTNGDFTRVLGRCLGKRTPFPLPAFLAKILFGEMANELFLASTRVEPKKLIDAEFLFQYRNLEDALSYLLE